MSGSHSSNRKRQHNISMSWVSSFVSPFLLRFIDPSSFGRVRVTWSNHSIPFPDKGRQFAVWEAYASLSVNFNSEYRRSGLSSKTWPLNGLAHLYWLKVS